MTLSLQLSSALGPIFGHICCHPPLIHCWDFLDLGRCKSFAFFLGGGCPLARGPLLATTSLRLRGGLGMLHLPALQAENALCVCDATPACMACAAEMQEQVCFLLLSSSYERILFLLLRRRPGVVQHGIRI
jgi:hypothetical protein